MKNNKPHPYLLLLALTLVLHAAAQQPPASFAGSWEGTLQAGVSLRLVFHIKIEEGGRLVATADSPDQGAYGMTCDTTFVHGDSLFVQMRQLGADYSGKMTSDSVIEGEFYQRIRFPLVLKRRVTSEAAKKTEKPQTPRPPFPYKSEDITYTNENASLEFGATITIPPGKGPFPAAIMITGSGPQNRDEEIMGHKPFAVIADYLTRMGFVILRTDDRGVGESTGNFREATSADFALDAEAGIRYLLSRPEVNKKKIGIIGHSEGGMIAPMVASGRNDIAFVVLMAAPGIPIRELMTEQNTAILKSAGLGEKSVSAYSKLYAEMLNKVMASSDSAKVIQDLYQSAVAWADTTDAETVKELELDQDVKKRELASAIGGAMISPWFRYFLSYDPAPNLRKLRTSVLAINGARDIQVVSSSNLAGISSALRKSKSKNVEIKELPGLNHLFQRCSDCTVIEYSRLEETISPDALKLIGDWLEKNVK